MKQGNRILACVLAITLVIPWAVPVRAAQSADVTFAQVENGEVKTSLLEEKGTKVSMERYKADDDIRVSIFLDEKSVVEQGFSTMGIGENRAAQSYRQKLIEQQDDTTHLIEAELGERLDVQWNLTMFGSIISANVKYGQIETIKAIPGVENVTIETRYEPMVIAGSENAEPNMLFAGTMTGVSEAWRNGFTGAGCRIAIIDTGTDTDHQSFSAKAFEYALGENAKENQMDYTAYVESLNLLDEAEINEKLSQLNAYGRGATNAADLYLNGKLPFAYSYVDRGFDITHDNDSAGNHGSHVAGISAANRYIQAGNEWVDALSSVYVAGTAPDAQILTMKVFGKNGGAYDSDFFAAIEDAIVLGADTVNLSLGSSSPGFTGAGAYQRVMDNLKNCDTTVLIAAGNASNWANLAQNSTFLGGEGYLYASDVITDTVGSPASYQNSLSVASVDNHGHIAVGSLMHGDSFIAFNENSTTPHPIDSLISLDVTEVGSGTEYEYVMVESYGAEGDFDNLDVMGKIVLVSRGREINFADKANRAIEAGAIATIIYNNVPGDINMNLDGYRHTQPCVIITQRDAQKIKENSTPNRDSAGEAFYTGKVSIVSGISRIESDDDYYTMSSFSSWGVPGDLTLKPEITAPGGNIYNVKGGGEATDQYVSYSGTSMATPHASGVGALVSSYVRQNGYSGEFANPTRGLVQSLMMSTAVPLTDGDGNYYPIIQQGAGLVDSVAATSAESYIKMNSDATASYDDGKVKAELGDDPERIGEYEFGFVICNLDGTEYVYDLYAHVFTQSHFAAQASTDGMYTTEYMSKVTEPLDAEVTFSVNGRNAESVSVPAGGKAEIQVRIKLTDEAKQNYLEKWFENGTFIQAFVYADAQATQEGVEVGTTHSIPVLSFYGSWTDPSMFWGTSSQDGQFLTNYRNDKISDNTRVDYFKLEYQIDVDKWKAYVPENTFTISNGDFSYQLGGNPLIADNVYMPERNAVSDGVILANGNFSLARNFSQSSLKVENITTDEVYYTTSYSSDYFGAYYNSTGYDYGNLYYAPNQEITGLIEGERIRFSATFLPEYYDAGKMGEGKSAGHGASAEIIAVVDDTIPQASKIEMNESKDELLVTAADNEFVAAVVMYNASGDRILSYAGAKAQIDPGESAVYKLDLRDVSDENILIQVFDYAMNAATYRAILDGVDDSFHYAGAMLAYDRDTSKWVVTGRNTDELSDMSGVTTVYNAATSIGDTIFAVSEDGMLYMLNPMELSEETFLKPLDHTVVDMAYNPSDGFIYGVSSQNNMIRIDLDTGEVREIGSMPFNTNTLACDADGVFYSNRYGTGEIYSYTLDCITTGMSEELDFNGDGDVNTADCRYLLDYVVGKADTIFNKDAADMDQDGDIDTYDVYLLQNAVPHKPKMIAVAANTRSAYLQAMEVDPNNGRIYWASYFTDRMQEDEIGFSFLWEIIPQTNEIIRHYDVWDELAALTILDMETSSHIKPANRVTKLNISFSEKQLSNGDTFTLEAGVFPWNAADQGVIWSSTDETVAAVDADGKVTAMGYGTCRIVARSVLDEDIYAYCDILVTENVEAGEESAAPAEQASAARVKNGAKSDVTQGAATVTLQLPASASLTNGLQTISFDDDMNLISVGGAELVSYSQKNNLLTVGYVHEGEIAAGDTAVILTFEMIGCKPDRTVILREVQRNNEHLSELSVIHLDTHSWSEWETVTEPGCEEDGVKVRVCRICAEREEAVIPAHGHSWSEWKLTAAPGCKEAGEETRVCETCLKEEHRTVQATGEHTWSAWEVTKATSCLTAGEEKRFCEECAEEQTREIPAFGVHEWSNWEVTVEAGEDTPGEEKRRCDRCGESELREIPATGICPSAQYTDLDTSCYYHEGVDFVLSHGYMVGISSTEFDPNGNLTRGQMVTILYRVAGTPDVSALENPFIDVKPGLYYTDAIIWAASECVVNGVGDGYFAPDQEITREQIATVLYRYEDAKPPVQDYLSSFVDAAAISGYAVDAMNWAVGEGLIIGMGNQTISPLTLATRAQFATILMRYLTASE